MIRCSECKNFTKVLIKNKLFFRCDKRLNEFGDPLLWQTIPKMHPHWCPLYKEQKNGYEKTT